jgi:hypothetical protein
MDYGIQIYLPQLNTLSIAEDGQSVTVGGGINSKALTDGLWVAGKQTGELVKVESQEPVSVSAFLALLWEVATVGFKGTMVWSLINLPR